MGPELMLLSTVASVGGQVMSMIQGVQQASYEGAVARQNEGIAKENAARARLDAAMAEEAQRREARKAMGRAAAAGSQAGIGAPGFGSLGAALAQGQREAELDALNIRYGGATEAHGFEVQAAQFAAERKAARQRAKGAVVSGVFGAASAGLSGFSDYRGRTRDAYTPKAAAAQRAPRTSARRHYTQLPRPAYGGR